MPLSEVTAYSVLMGAYDDVPPAPYGGVLFTDQPVKPDGWQVRTVKPPHSDSRYASRWFICHSCQILPECQYTVWHNANARLLVEPELLISWLPEDRDIGCFVHSSWRTLIEEAMACVLVANDKKEVIEQQVQRYFDEGFPPDAVISGCILLIRRNTPRLAEFEALWWEEIKNGSWRNQLSFDYCRWKTGLPSFPIYRYRVRRPGSEVPNPLLEIVGGHL